MSVTDSYSLAVNPPISNIRLPGMGNDSYSLSTSPLPSKQRMYFKYFTPEDRSKFEVDFFGEQVPQFTAEGYFEFEEAHLQAEYDKVTRALNRLQPFRHLAFKIAVPYDTRTACSTLKSLFIPMTSKVIGNADCNVSAKTGFTSVVDLVTLAMRIVTIVPRILQQRKAKPMRLAQIAGHEPFMVKGLFSEIDWTRGMLQLDHPYDPDEVVLSSNTFSRYFFSDETYYPA
jgi:hypothetical protein